MLTKSGISIILKAKIINNLRKQPKQKTRYIISKIIDLNNGLSHRWLEPDYILALLKPQPLR